MQISAEFGTAASAPKGAQTEILPVEFLFIVYKVLVPIAHVGSFGKAEI